MKKIYAVYIMTNSNNTVLYTGVTSNLEGRIWQHREKIVPGFTSKYNANKLVYYELFSEVSLAIEREKQIKKWRRDKKINLINSINSSWLDLSDKII
ncbi:putative endonuclease [Parelusimicrobium proximum]|uniref:GIY-YIG nuclease family protein n=1 Tax=Parelusimicrobium proximum TaxID=3228953 RepID=UPI003D1780B9